MLSEGLYSLDYWTSEPDPGTRGIGAALVAFRNGRVLGSDQWGGVIDGSCADVAEGGACRVCVRLLLPPDGQLITGEETGPAGRVLDVDCEFASAAPVATSVVELMGRKVGVKLRYIGPLPG